jgi:hypothetical protein
MTQYVKAIIIIIIIILNLLKKIYIQYMKKICYLRGLKALVHLITNRVGKTTHKNKKIITNKRTNELN